MSSGGYASYWANNGNSLHLHNWSAFNPIANSIGASGKVYPGGDGGAFNWCTLYPRSGFNPCGGKGKKSDCLPSTYLTYLIIILLVLWFLFVEQPTSS